MMRDLTSNFVELKDVNFGDRAGEIRDLLTMDSEGRAYMINFKQGAMYITPRAVEQSKRFDTDGLLELLE